MSVLCRHFGTCGGCTFQDMPGHAYREMKRERVERTLARRGLEGLRIELPAEIPPGTRRRGSLKAAKQDGSVKIGFHAARTHSIVDLQECHVLSPALVELVPALRGLLAAVLRNGETLELSLTECDGASDLALVLERELDARCVGHIAQWADQNRIARVSVNGETVIRLATPGVRLAGIQVELPVRSFLQPTIEGECLLQDFVREAMTGARRIADLFSGCGTFALALAGQARLHAVDSDRPALSALLAAARKTQKLKPVTAEVRDLAKRPLQPKELSRFDAAVLDPPRAGALAQARALGASSIGRVAYLSCNPESFARDARILVDGGFQIGRVQPVDQFLWSSHIELAAVLVRR